MSSATSLAEDGSEVLGHLNFFPLILPDEEDANCVVDFAAITAFTPSDLAVDHFLSGKVFEMTDETRSRFKFKLAAFLGRPSDDD